MHRYTQLERERGREEKERRKGGGREEEKKGAKEGRREREGWVGLEKNKEKNRPVQAHSFARPSSFYFP